MKKNVLTAKQQGKRDKLAAKYQDRTVDFMEAVIGGKSHERLDTLQGKVIAAEDAIFDAVSVE